MGKRTLNRRDFIKTSSVGVGALLVGCESDGSTSTAATDAAAAETAETDTAGGGSDITGGDVLAPADQGPEADLSTPDAGPDTGPGEACADPFAGGTLLGTLNFLDEGAPTLNTPFGAGLDGREYFDLSQLDPDQMLTPVEAFYIRTRTPDRLPPTDSWTVTIDGLVEEEVVLTMADLEPPIEDMGVHVLECSGNGAFANFGMLSATTWRGVPVEKVFEKVKLAAGAALVHFNGFDDHSQPSGNSLAGANWILSTEQLAQAGAFLATHMGGEPLQLDHGFPVRLFIPRWYGCCCVKWLDRITFVDANAASTEHMREYASRTHQSGIPSLARNYAAATRDQTAMPVRVEKWRVGDQIKYRLVGIMWGGYEPTDKLQVSLNDGNRESVDVCPAQTTNDTWTLWTHAWTPSAMGEYAIRCHIDDPNIVTKRLDSGFYTRIVEVDEV